MADLICEICGNPFDVELFTCPYCEHEQSIEHRQTQRPDSIQFANLEYGFPTREDAVENLLDEISHAKQNGVVVLKIIHGYGSTGKGGVIRHAVRKKLQELKQNGIIENWHAGENKGDLHFSRHLPSLDFDNDWQFSNPGISFILL